MLRSVTLLALLCGVAHSVESSKNPIRKVVTLMQNMQKEIEAEGEKEKELHEKFLCYCKSSFAELTKTSEDSGAKIEELSAKLKAEEAEKTQIAQELLDHKKDRESAKQDLEESSSLRAKEAGEYAAAKADSETNIAAMAAAIPALEKGMSGASLMQMPSFGRVKQLVSSYPNMDAIDRRDALAFLDQTDQSGDYTPSSGQIVGILKQMKDDFEANLADATSEEEKAVAGFKELSAEKQKEIEVATESIETKMARSGELAVSVVQSKDGLEDSTEAQSDAEKSLSALKGQCAAKEKDYAAKTKTRADEVAAISQAIGVLNDDDALDVFKKAVPGAALTQVEWTGFLQRSAMPASKARKAQALLQEIAAKHKSPALNLMLFTLKSKLRRSHGGSGKFEEVVKMVDDMVVLLGKQQVEDDKQKEWCKGEFDKADDEEAATKSALASIEASVSEMTDAIATITDEVKALVDEVTELDHTVATATVQRKEEHTEYIEAVQMQSAAIALIEKAKNKLNKFYNPAEYKAPPPEFAQVSSFVQVRAHEEFDDDESVAQTAAASTAYKRNEKSAGVMALMDQIIHDTEMAQQESEFGEKTAQNDYADLMNDAQASRAQATKSITDKTASKAELESKLVAAKENQAATQKELLAIGKMIADLHSSCDFLIENYDLRKEARSNEIDSLKNAKAVLSGATS